MPHASGSNDAPLALRLLGEFGAFVGGEDVRPRGRKARGLLAYVAMAPGRSAGRDRLAALLWSDRGEEQARGSLRQTLAELRQGPIGAGDHVAADRETIRCRAGAVETDVERILDAATRHDLPALADRMQWVGTGLLVDLDGLSPAFDDWLRVERVRREEQVVSAVVAAMEAVSDAQGADIQAVLASLDRLSPFNEAVARLRMHADHEAGDAASLHRRYRRLTEDLAREYGSRPSAETAALFNRLTAIGAAAPPRPAPAGAGQKAAEQVMPPTVMVSPLIAADPRPATATLAADCTEDIRAALAGQQELRIIALDLVDLDRVRAVCADALSAYIMSGRLRVNDAVLTASLQLGNIASGVVVWSQQLRLAIDDPGQALERIVACAAGAVVPAIERDLAGPLAQSGERRDTVTLYARGQRTREARTLPEARAAAALLEEVVARDRLHAGARLRLAQLYNTDFRYMIAGHDVAAFRARALALAEEAVAIDRSNLRARMRLAWCHLRRRGWAVAEREFRTAAETMSYDADGLNECGFALVFLGELNLAEPLMDRAFQINPFAPADYHADYAAMLALRGDAEAAEAHFSVSGENGLLYQAVRLANLSALPGAGSTMRMLADPFRAAFRDIWVGPSPPSTSDILGWSEEIFPLRRPEHQAFMRERLSAALG